METITIPKNEYLDLLNLYHKITKKIEKIEKMKISDYIKKKLDAHKYCGLISIDNDALTIQNQMRNEWE